MTRREEIIQTLGGKCARCGSSEELEFDHVDPSTKKFSIAVGLAYSEALLMAEVAKCQLLCRSCHVWKTWHEDKQRKSPDMPLVLMPFLIRRV